MGTAVGQSWGAADLSSIPAGILQAQQQRDEALEHQLPQGAAEAHPEPTLAPPHQRPEKPEGRGADRVPGLRARARSGQTENWESLGRAAVWTVMGGGGAGRGGTGRNGGGRQTGGAELTSSSSRGRQCPSSVLRSRTGARGRSRSLRSAPSAASTSLVSPSPRAPRSVGSSVLTCRTCGAATGGRPLAPRPSPCPPALSLTFPWLRARCPRPSRPSQRTVGSGSPCQARSRSRMTSSRKSRAVGRLCNS